MKRLDIIDQKENILIWITENQPKSVISKNLNCKPETLNSYLKKLNIEYRGVLGKNGFKKIPIEIYLKNERPIKSNELKLKLYDKKLKEPKCENCGITEWNLKLLTFELHHNDGNIHNNNLVNLKILCPNCHSQTDYFRIKKMRHE